MENTNDNSGKSALTKDDLVAALSELLKEKSSEEEKPAIKEQPREDISAAVEKYLEKKESQKKAQEILEKAEIASQANASSETAPSLFSPEAHIEGLRAQLEKHIDNIRAMLDQGDYDPELMRSSNDTAYLRSRRMFWHWICHNKGGKEGSEFILSMMRKKGVRHPAAYEIKYSGGK